MRTDSIMATQIAVLAQTVADLEDELAKKESTITFLLGDALLQASRSWKSAVQLPRRLFAIHVEATRRKLGKGASSNAVAHSRSRSRSARAQALELYLVNGVRAFDAGGGVNYALDEKIAHLHWLSSAFKRSSPAESVILARAAFDLSPLPSNGLVLALALERMGAIAEVKELVAHFNLCNLPSVSRASRFRLKQVLGLSRLASDLTYLGREGRPRSVPSSCGSIAYVMHCSYPHDNNGYARRSHSLATMLARTGREDIVWLTRPGYPIDRKPHYKNLSKPAIHTVEGVKYESLEGADITIQCPYEYSISATNVLIETFRSRCVRIVHAASSIANALAAYRAARFLGLTFIYEVRGLWELTAISKRPEIENSEYIDLIKKIENFIIVNSDFVVTLSQCLKDEIVKRTAIDPQKILLLRNCVLPEEFGLLEDQVADEHGTCPWSDKIVVGFIGSILSYEGLDDLVEVARKIIDDRNDVHFVIVGEGDASFRLRSKIIDSGVSAYFSLVGRVSPNEVNRYYSYFDVAVYPRRPEMVCELVPPLKPLEAMARGIPVLISDVGALKELVGGEGNAMVFEKGNLRDFHEKLLRLLTSEKLREEYGSQGRNFAQQNRNWQFEAKKVIELWNEIEGGDWRGRGQEVAP